MEKQSFKGVPESNWVVGPCQTEEIAKQVLAVAHAYGWKWCSGNLFIDKTNWNGYKKGTYYNIAIGEYCDLWYWKSRKCTIISPETFLANNQMPGEKLEEKTRKPGVKYTLDDWKKEADACRKRAEYWKDKHSDTLKKAMELQTANKVLKEGNENLRNSNDELLKSSTEASQEIGFAKLKIQDLEKERDETAEELKTVKSHLELRIKGIQALEHDAKLNRIEIASLKSDFETKNSELEILEEDYNCLKDVQKYTKVVGWAGWIFFFIALFGLMFFKG